MLGPTATAATALGLGGATGYGVHSLLSKEDTYKNLALKNKNLGPTGVLAGVGGIAGLLGGYALGDKLITDVPSHGGKALGAGLGGLSGAAIGATLGNIISL